MGNESDVTHVRAGQPSAEMVKNRLKKRIDRRETVHAAVKRWRKTSNFYGRLSSSIMYAASSHLT